MLDRRAAIGGAHDIRRPPKVVIRRAAIPCYGGFACPMAPARANEFLGRLKELPMLPGRTKRQKEQERAEYQRKKKEEKARQKEEKANRPPRQPGEPDPDIADIVPGPQAPLF